MPDNVQDILDTGLEAHRELTVVEECIEDLKKDIHDRLILCKPGQDQERRNLCQTLQISEMVLDYLKLSVNKAKHAKNKIDDIQKVGKTSMIDRFIP